MSIQRKLRWFAAALGVVFASAPAFASPPGPERTTIFGATFALTGKLANKGQDEAAGISFAFEDLRRRHAGFNPVLIVEDNQGEPKQAVAGFQKLLAADNVQVLISAFTHLTQAVKGLAAQSGKPFIYISGAKSIVAENPSFFRDYYDIEQSGRAMAGVAAAARNFRKVGYLREDGEACTLHENGFKEGAARAGIQIAAREEYAAGDSDLRPLLLKLSRQAPEAIVACTWRDTATLMRRLDELKLLSIPVLHVEAPNSDINDSPEIRRLYEKNRSISAWYGFIEDSPSPAAARFIERFRERFGRKPLPDALLAYDLGIALGTAAEKCVKDAAFDQACFISELSRISFDGVCGPFRFDETRNSTRPVLMMEVKNGKWIELETDAAIAR